MARATISLPVPLSPVIRMVALVGAACCSRAKISCMEADSPIRSPRTPREASSRSRRPAWVANCRRSSARSTIIFSACGCSGFSMNQNAPNSWTVSSAVSRLPNAVRTMAGGGEGSFCSSSSSPLPSRLGMLRSVMTTSASKSLSLTSASAPSQAVSTWYPQRVTTLPRAERWLTSSSTTRILAEWFCISRRVCSSEFSSPEYTGQRPLCPVKRFVIDRSR